MDDKNIPTFIEGENVQILPVNMEHLNLYQKWENSPKVRLYARNILPLTADDLKKRLESSKESVKSVIWFEIHHKAENKPIGSCEVSEINWYNHSACLGVLLGETDMWGKNICTEVINLLSEYAFNELNMRKLSVYIFSPNIGSWRCAEKCGYTREAVMKEDYYIDGKHEDTFIYSLFKKDWINLKK
jgi:RimJ/RimL family protein N-acetyltransferase